MYGRIEGREENCGVGMRCLYEGKEGKETEKYSVGITCLYEGQEREEEN